LTRSLQLYVTALVAVSIVALAAALALFGINPNIGLTLSGQPSGSSASVVAGMMFWIVITILSSALPVQMPRGILIAVSTAPIVAAMDLGGPAAAGLVALIGVTEWRELRGRIPWYGSLANHAGVVIPAIAGGVLTYEFQRLSPSLGVDLFATVIGASFFFVLNLTLASGVAAVRQGIPLRELVVSDLSGFAVSLAALAPLGWLMGRIYLIPEVGWWMTLLFGVPLFTTRISYQRFAEMREMFTQTIGALAEAVDKRDPYTSQHSRRVRLISVDIGRELRVSAAEMEALEWGGLLHDVGKIGVPDSVLLKQGKLTRDERITMNAHPVLGAQIISPVDRLAPELPVIRHHHEWYNGSGYPDRLMGDEIPRLARILHVADAFEAMTADRPYRKALSKEQALAELRKFAGVQFDPECIDAFVKTSWADEARDSDAGIVRPIPLIGQVAARQAAAYDAPAPGSPAADLA
jgi:HD domain